MPDPVCLIAQDLTRDDLRERARVLLDPYLDPFWQILRNKVHARTASELAAAETQLVWARSLEFTERPIGGRYDLTHLRALHRHLFQDVYPFAGDLRTVDLRKADDPGGWFHPAARLTQEADSTFAALAQD